MKLFSLILWIRLSILPSCLRTLQVFIANHCKAIFLILIFTFYANGSACIWLFYECEKDDIILMICPEGNNTEEFALQLVHTALSHHNHQQSKQTVRIVETDITISVSTMNYFQIYNPSHQLTFTSFFDNLIISNGYPFLQIRPPRYSV